MTKIVRVAIGAGVLVLLALVAWLYAGDTRQVVKIGDASLTVRVVRSEAERERGLSGSQPLGADEGMLFVFPETKPWEFWMKDMNYPIDIVWLDDAKTVVSVSANATPESYPKIYRPDQPARYVVEMKAGTAKLKRITIGTRAVFDPAQEK